MVCFHVNNPVKFNNNARTELENWQLGVVTQVYFIGEQVMTEFILYIKEYILHVRIPG